MTQLALPIQIIPRVRPPLLRTTHLPNRDDASLTLCDEACTYYDPVSDDVEDCECLECWMVYEKTN